MDKKEFQKKICGKPQIGSFHIKCLKQRNNNNLEPPQRQVTAKLQSNKMIQFYYKHNICAYFLHI